MKTKEENIACLYVALIALTILLTLNQTSGMNTLPKEVVFHEYSYGYEHDLLNKQNDIPQKNPVKSGPSYYGQEAIEMTSTGYSPANHFELV